MKISNKNYLIITAYTILSALKLTEKKTTGNDEKYNDNTKLNSIILENNIHSKMEKDWCESYHSLAIDHCNIQFSCQHSRYLFSKS